jgi:hypothetical protein
LALGLSCMEDVVTMLSAQVIHYEAPCPTCQEQVPWVATQQSYKTETQVLCSRCHPVIRR